MQIILRQLTDPIPEGWVPGVRWVVEAYPAGQCNLPYPMGSAWVSDYTGHGSSIISLDYILVSDHFRKSGIAKALYNAIKERWPTVMVTDAISPSGEAFLDAVEPWRAGARQAQKSDEIAKRNKERRTKRKERKQARQRR